MATEGAINGNYTPHQGYGAIDQNHSGYTNTSSYNNTASSTSATANAGSTHDIPKDEVGWYFVEQYYTTLSRSPEKLYLFYNKRSQYVSGNETEKSTVSVGQRAINERIKELEFQETKVRVTNVDSQASDQNIVIQVIGEISNKSAPHKKFTQTFVLAGQTNGYFVLNDIFRYIVEEEDEISAEDAPQETETETETADVPSGVQEPAPTAEATEPETLTSSSDPAAVEADAAKVDKELEEKVVEAPAAPVEAEAEAPEPSINGTTDEAEVAESEPAADAATPATEDAPAEIAEPTATEISEPEKPKDPEPTPALSPAKPEPAQPVAQPAQAAPAAPAKPAAPKTWANLAAAAHRVVTPAVTAPQPSTSAVPAQPKAAPVPVQAAPATAGAPARETSPAGQQDEWNTVGGDHKRQQSKAQASTGAQEASQNRAYIKNVSETIDAKDLRATLEKYGEISYFDIARQKNCAFVDFKTAEGYKAAINANPHQIGEEQVVIEERRVKPGSYPYVQRGGMRGGRGAPSNTGGGRGSFQGGRGGNFPQRGRGANNSSSSSSAGRGRGGAQAA